MTHRYSRPNFTAQREQGFTLMELLIVLAIVALLAALIGPQLFGRLEGGRRTAAAAQIASFETALDTYRLDIGRYPESLEGLVENDSGRDAWNGPYMDEIPLDPWGNPYQYEGDRRSFELLSFGADGQPGGEGDDADISS